MSILSLAIPTFNRPDIIYGNLSSILDELIELSIPVYISDDSSNDDTKLIISELQVQYDKIYYVKNTPGLGHDLNCIRTLSLPSEDYIWYLGDSILIGKGELSKIIDLLESEDFDFVFCNAVARNLSIPSKTMTDPLEIFDSLSWHLTMTGASIYKKSRIGWISDLDLSKFKNFPQTAIVFESLIMSPVSVKWINRKIISTSLQKKSYWSKSVFNVFIDDYQNFVKNLSNFYPLLSKINSFKKHSVNSGIFTYRSIFQFRMNGYYDKEMYQRYGKALSLSSNLNQFFLFIISMFPKKVIKYFYHLNLKVNGNNF